MRFSPLKENSLVILIFWIDAVQLGDGDFFAGPQLAVKDARDGEAAEVVAVIKVSDQYLQRTVSSPFGAGIVLTMASNSGCRFSPGLSMSVVAVPSFALVYRTGKSSWSSPASRSMNRS